MSVRQDVRDARDAVQAREQHAGGGRDGGGSPEQARERAPRLSFPFLLHDENHDQAGRDEGEVRRHLGQLDHRPVATQQGGVHGAEFFEHRGEAPRDEDDHGGSQDT